MSRRLSDAERGIQKFVIRNPIDVDQAIAGLAGGTLPKNTMYITLLKEALEQRGIYFDNYHQRIIDPPKQMVVIEVPIAVGNPAMWQGNVVTVKGFIAYENGELEADLEIDAPTKMLRPRIDANELEPFRYTPKIKNTRVDSKGATPVPTELL